MDNSFKYQKEGLAKDLVTFLMEDNGWSIEKAFEVLYDSETYSKICNPKTGLYFQGSLYVYSFLKNEVNTGIMH